MAKKEIDNCGGVKILKPSKDTNQKPTKKVGTTKKNGK